MIKSFIVDMTCKNMRIDRLLRSKLGKLPQSLIEKSLRSGKIKLNKKKVKSSFKVSINDKVELFNFKFKEIIKQKKIIFNPSDEIIKANEDLVIDNNDNFVVLNKKTGISVQGGTKSKKNLIDIFAKVKFLTDQNLIQFIDWTKIHREFLSLLKIEKPLSY